MAHAKFVDDLPHLRRGEPIGAGLREVVRGCGERAVQRGELTASEMAVHEARRALKRARAALRIGEELGVAGAQAARRRLAKLARELSPQRDAVVAAKVAAQAAGGEKRRAVAVGEAEREDKAARWWAAWQRRMAAEARRCAALEWGETTAEALEAALAVAAKRVCRKAKQAREKGGIARAHAWRKAAIVLREQVLVAWPRLRRDVRAAAGELHALARGLGRATDFQVFVEAVRRRGADDGGGRLARFGKDCRRRALRKARERWPRVRRVLRREFGGGAG